MRNTRPIVYTVLLIIASISFGSCGAGCMDCTGATADQVVCKDDYQETSDYQKYLDEYAAQGGICEEQ